MPRLVEAAQSTMKIKLTDERDTWRVLRQCWAWRGECHFGRSLLWLVCCFGQVLIRDSGSDRGRKPRAVRIAAALLITLVAVGSRTGLAEDGCPQRQPERSRPEPARMRIRMPGKSHQGPLPPLTAKQMKLRDELRVDLTRLATEIGERNAGRPAAYLQARKFLESELQQAGYEVRLQKFQAKGIDCANVEAAIAGGEAADEIVVVGAHYDSAPGTPGANDNGTGVVGLLAIARRLADFKSKRTLRLVFFANEEPPFFQTDAMGSLVYARACRDRGDKVVGMLSLETIGYYSDEPNSQNYPAPFNAFYPTTGNFVGFVGNMKSGALVETCVGSFRQHAKFPSEGGAVPAFIQGVGWSDHWSFWQTGYPALMVTDTAPFRYPHYHLPSDTPDKVDFDRFARVVDGLERVVRDLAKPDRADSAKKMKEN